MKKLITLLVFLLCSPGVQAQMVVFDPKALVEIKKTISQGAEKIKHLRKQAKFLEEAKDKVVKVNRKVREIKSYSRLIESSNRSLKALSKSFETIIKEPDLSVEHITKIDRNYNDLTRRIEDNLIFIGNLMKDDYWTLSDAERIEMIQKKEEEMRRLEGKIWLKNKEWEYTIRKIKFAKATQKLSKKNQ